MKKLTQVLGVVAIGLVSFSFTTKNEAPVATTISIVDEAPKVVILDIVDNVTSKDATNITQDFKSKLETLNKDNVKVLLWKEITDGMKDEEKQAIIDSLKPELIMTVSFENSDDNTNKIAAVVSKQNVAFEETFKIAREFADNLNSTSVKNEGVYQADSKYIQDNAAPAIFLSVKAKNEPTSNQEIVNKISNFIESVNFETPTTVETIATIDAAVDTATAAADSATVAAQEAVKDAKQATKDAQQKVKKSK
ncbi:Uncharacterised protein [Algoriella xinjiangensis]|jgi:hypothetical protein|uniref:hypothetical protein n=1 Tax=Algoriella xinjiangensis TaxID=684065 RepID=UPI000F62E762|nr:hypothetical protein [Algoriella xinjiangensis]VDH15161.1 Uncharacterised protein [Algoriella xinjiangensis]